MSMNLRISSSPNGLRNTINDDIKVTYGAAGDGVTNDAQKFVDFQTARTGQTLPVTLIEPAGTYNLGSGSTAQTFMRGVLNARLVGAGQGVTVLSYTGASPVQFGGKALTFDNLHSARCATVSAGATSVTLIDSSKASRFTVGNYAMMAGFDLQGYGDPCNPHFMEYVKVTAINAGVISFDRSLINSYKSTWPLYNDGSNYLTGGGMDQGGPATLYALDSTFSNSVEVRDQTVSQGNNQTYASGLDITFRNVTFTGNAGAIPSSNYLWRSIGCTYSGTSSIEVDKLVTEASFQSGTTRNIVVQSSSVDLLRLTDQTVNLLSGTAKGNIVTGGSIADLSVGAAAYGRTDYVTIGPSALGNPVVSAVSAGSFTDSTATYSMASGIITSPNSGGPLRWAVPGTNVFWRGTEGYEGLFKVTDITQDATNTYVQTNQAGGFPATGGALSVGPHPCPVWNCTSATGCDDIVSLSYAGAQNRPLLEYSKRSYAGVATAGYRLITSASLGSALYSLLVGELVSIKINVLTPYTGPNGTMNFKLSQFDNYTYFKQVDGTTASLGTITINTLIAGERVISKSAPTGAKSGDTLPTIPAACWLAKKPNSGPVLSADVSAQAAGPLITVEIITSQGVS